MYYLQSRYYNPEWGRFINEDEYGGSIGTILSHNQFSYCINNPVFNIDPNGNNTIVLGIPWVLPAVQSLTGALVQVGIATLSTLATLITIDYFATQQKIQTKVLEDVLTSKPNEGEKVYHVAYADKNTENLIVTKVNLNFNEARDFLRTSKDKNLYAKNQTLVGIYTKEQSHAKSLAESVNASPGLPKRHFPGYYGHYHDDKHIYHIWYGEPIC